MNTAPVPLTRPYTERRLRAELDALGQDLVIKKNINPPYRLRGFYARCRVSGNEVLLSRYGHNVRPDYKRLCRIVEQRFGLGIIYSV